MTGVQTCALPIFPQERDLLAQLPGVGRSTAAAIAALAFGKREAILDGNAKRVLARHAAIEGHYSQRAVEVQLWALAEARLPAADRGGGSGGTSGSTSASNSGIEAYTQGLMDLGSMLCTRGKPDCASCPVNSDCLALAQGRQTSLPTPRPKKLLPQRETVMLLLEHYKIETKGKHAVVIGRSNIVGRPMSILLSANAPYGNCTVTICHSHTKNLKEVCASADILVAALGRPEFVTADMVKDGAVVIDVGITRVEDATKKKGYAIKGDVKFEEVSPRSSFITPVQIGRAHV